MVNKLGATLYVPGTHRELLNIANAQKYNNLKSVVFCTEDSIKKSDLEHALSNISNSLEYFIQNLEIMRFIRPRNLDVFEEILKMKYIHNIDGFVLPKVTIDSLLKSIELLEKYHSSAKIMITLETVDVFNVEFLVALSKLLETDSIKKRVLCLRIGGLDLLNLLNIKRRKGETIYDTPLRKVILDIVTIFKPLGHNITSCAYEYFDDFKTLENEIRLDFANGLMGKTVIHPVQIDVVHAMYAVNEKDFDMATKIADSKAPSVFKCQNSMCEVATHINWANNTLERASVYGVKKTPLSNCYYMIRTIFYSTIIKFSRHLLVFIN